MLLGEMMPNETQGLNFVALRRGGDILRATGHIRSRLNAATQSQRAYFTFTTSNSFLVLIYFLYTVIKIHTSCVKFLICFLRERIINMGMQKIYQKSVFS